MAIAGCMITTCFCGAPLPPPKHKGAPPTVCPGSSVYVDGKRIRTRSACEEIRGAVALVRAIVDGGDLTPGQASWVARELNAQRMRVARRAGVAR